MNGVLYIEDATIEATTGQLLVTFTSGGDDFRFHLPPHIALLFRERMLRDSWPLLCAPDAEVVSLAARRARARRDSRDKREG